MTFKPFFAFVFGTNYSDIALHSQAVFQFLWCDKKYKPNHETLEGTLNF